MPALCIFIADVHLGLQLGDSEAREKAFARFLNGLSAQDTAAVYLLGDVFDFWYEYKDVIPRRFTRTLGALAGLTDRGVAVHFFPGNHDVWAYDYFERELGMTVHRRDTEVVAIGGKRFLLGHADRVSCGHDRGYRFLYGVFHNRGLQRLFSMLPPRWAFGLARNWSRHNRLMKEGDYNYASEQAEPLFRFAAKQEVDYVVVGHLHTPCHRRLSNGADLYVLGDWLHHAGYLAFDGEEMVSRSF